MELRSEESPDVSPYCHERNVQTIVLSIGEDVSTLRDNLASVLEKLLEKLERMKIIHHRPVSNWSMFALLKAREVIRKGAQNGFNPSQRNMVEGIFAQLMSLYHAYELLMSHGIRSFYNYVKERLDPRSRGTLMSDENFRSSYDYLAEKFVPGNADESNANIATDMSDGCANHPKIVKLKEILMEHFQGFSGDEKDTRVMVFAQYRESVNEICVALEKLSPTVKPLPFVGQSAASKNNKGISQKEQLKNVEKFKSGEYNTLVSTCIGEEGLDIGEVDLIVCYDSPTSPIRLVQRMGRTGRARQGKIIVLLTEGKEEQVRAFKPPFCLN